MAGGLGWSWLGRMMRGTWMAKLSVFAPPLIVVVLGFAIAGNFVQPAPPDHFIMATGGETGAYHAFGKRYRDVLAREGVELKLRTTSGSVENVELLRKGEVDAAFVQSGVATPAADDELYSLASLYYEPLWVFHRPDNRIRLLSDLAGMRVAVGGVGSGTRAAAEPLLALNGVTAETARIVDLGGPEAAEALRRGTVDAAFYVGSPEAQLIRGLLTDRDLQLLSFARAEAYTRHFRHMSKVLLPRGLIDFRADVPAVDKALLAPAAIMVVHDRLHPALRTLLLRAATEIHRPGGLFETPGEFPSIRFVDFPLTDKARRYIEDGPSILDRYLPYWVADMIVRLSILLLPLITLMIPLMRILPPLYRWRMRARIMRWYREMVKLEEELRDADTPQHRAEILTRLEEIDDEVSQVSVPVGYRDTHYTLRFHIDMLRGRLERRKEAEMAEAAEAEAKDRSPA